MTVATAGTPPPFRSSAGRSAPIPPHGFRSLDWTAAASTFEFGLRKRAPPNNAFLGAGWSAPRPDRHPATAKNVRGTPGLPLPEKADRSSHDSTT